MNGQKYVVVLLLFSLLVACMPANNAQLSGRVLLWHRFDEQDTIVLQQILSQFSDIYPDVQVVSAAVPPDELLERYKSTATQGLGPDLLIGSNDWVGQLAKGELIKDINGQIPDTSMYLPSAISSLQLPDPSTPEETVPLYGLPLSLRPVALYYNTRQVKQPATTLDELLAHAAEGQQVALPTSFDQAFWGIQAFGGKLFDESGRVILDQGGFANWLNWLKQAQSEPGMILNQDDLTLRELFIEEKVAYYVGEPEILPLLQEQLPDNVGVAPLPAGPHGASGPLLGVEALMFNPSSSRNQSKLALELAQFLSNAQQSTLLMRKTTRVPANQRVRVDARAFPIIAGFAAQARTATAVPPSNWSQMTVVRELGNNSYTEVLQGATDLTAATLKLTNQVNEQFGFDLVQIPDETCQLAGRVTVWHREIGSTERALQEMGLGFERQCPSAQVTLTRFASEEELYNSLMNSAERPNLIIGPHDWVWRLAQNEQIVPITAEIDLTMQQAYMPAALSALAVGEELFGLPFTLDFVTLYINSANSSPTTLDELLNQATTGQTVILPTTFDEAFWGISAFSETLFDEESAPVWEEGFIEWLTWLQQAQKTSEIRLNNQEVLSDTIPADLIVAPASQLEELQTDFEQLRVAQLPAGPAGEARPLLHVYGFIFPEAPTEVVLGFARYATDTNSQERLMERALRVPINVNVKKEGYPAIEILFSQAQNTILYPYVLQRAPLRSRNWVYNDVLVDQFDPVKTVCQFTQAIKQENELSTADLSPACTSDSN